MLHKILERLDIPSKQSHFKQPPKTTYLLWYDNVRSRGGDLENCIKEHGVSFELYAYSADPEAEAKIEQALDDVAVEWQKTERQWLQTEQLYMTIYDFDYIEKEKKNGN